MKSISVNYGEVLIYQSSWSLIMGIMLKKLLLEILVDYTSFSCGSHNHSLAHKRSSPNTYLL
jgi:hypothetical protein